ncbi:MAG: corrinoid protein [Chloroflexi bacterium]|uniref:corrinoid protein n=1 Tax=Candidatus Flexifilum breve TaxID=3140694 RepID=UPI003134A0E9|nr:corrinoid protein [Chloroflexota bacterium]
MALLEDIRQAVIDGNAKATVAKVEEGLAAGLDANRILNDALISGMQEVGRLFEEGEYFVPEMLIAARAMTAALKILRPLLAAQGVRALGKIAIGTVQGDLHDIGKSLVIMMLEGAGFEIVDLGIDVPAERFIEAARGGAQIVAMSALLTTTMTNMKTVIDALKAENVRDQVRVLIGGAPITQSYADEIGADGYAPDATSAVRVAQSLLGEAG